MARLLPLLIFLLVGVVMFVARQAATRRGRATHAPIARAAGSAMARRPADATVAQRSCAAASWPACATHTPASPSIPQRPLVRCAGCRVALSCRQRRRAGPRERRAVRGLRRDSR